MLEIAKIKHKLLQEKMETVNITLDSSGRERGYLFDKFAISVGQEIDGFINVTINGPPLPRPPIVICSTEQTTAFTAHAYNVGISSFSIVVHRMDTGPYSGGNPPQSFFVNVAIFFPD